MDFKDEVYVLEVQMFINDIATSEFRNGMNGVFIHIGYMYELFNSREEAVKYYRLYNPDMRPPNAWDNNSWHSDWDPKTKLRYIVRQYYGEQRNIPNFKEKL